MPLIKSDRCFKIGARIENIKSKPVSGFHVLVEFRAQIDSVVAGISIESELCQNTGKMDKNNSLALDAIQNCKNQYQKVNWAIEQYLSTIGVTGILAPIIVKFDFHYAELAATSGKFPFRREFLKLLLDEPVQCLTALRQAVFFIANTKLAGNEDYIMKCRETSGVKVQQIHCAIRFTGLPLTEKEFIFRPYAQPVRFGVTAMYCVLSGLGEQGTYVQQSIWYCPAKCPGMDYCIIGRCPFDWTQSYNCPPCAMCTNKMVEHTNYRTVAEYRCIKVHLAEMVRAQKQASGYIKWGITVQLMDEACHMELKLGDEYIVVGNFDPMVNRFKAWNISPF